MLKENQKCIRIGMTLILSILLIMTTVQAANHTVIPRTEKEQTMDSPLLLSTFLGGNSNDGMYYTGVNTILDEHGNIFIAGATESPNFPVTSGSYSTDHNGGSDVFVVKINNELTEVLACTYIGGNNNEEARAMTIDEQGDIIICGITESSDFPTTQKAFQTSYNGGTESPYGSGDAFVMIINNDLTSVQSSTYLGGSGHETCSSIDIDGGGNIIVSGSTSSSNFPVSETAYDTTYDSGGTIKDDVYVTKFNNDLTEMIASTYLGSSHDDFSEAMTIDSSDHIFVTGWTRSPDFPTTENAYDTTFGRGYYDGFISKLNDDLTDLISSTYIGGSQWDFNYALGLDADDNVYVSGHTASLNYPTTSNAYCETYQGVGGPNEGDDAFISKLNNDLTLLLASTYLGGDNWEMGYSLIVSGTGMIYLSGTTSSDDFPTMNSFDDDYNGGEKHYGDIFISCLTGDLEMLAASSYLGGNGNENAGQIALDGYGNVFVTGSTFAQDFPIIDGAYDITHNGDSDVFISKFQKGLSTNQAPEKPDINGPTSGKAGEEYEYTITTEDNEADEIYYLIDWGDGSITVWSGPYSSNENYMISYSWSGQGEYQIRVKARDIYGFESEWSDPLTVSMPKSKIKFLSFNQFFETHPFHLSLFRMFMS